MDVICDGCGRRNPASRRFCQQCGRYLSPDLERVPPEPAPGPPRPVPAAVPGGAAPVDQPTAVTGSPPDTGYAPAPNVEPGEVACPSCGTGNAPELAFCKHCGDQLRAGSPGGVSPQPTPTRASWWQRFRQRWTWGASAESRSRYRAALPARYWLIRIGIPVSLFGLVSAFFFWTGGDPVGWVRDRYHDIRGTVEPLEVTGAKSVPKPVGDDRAAAITSPGKDDAWQTPWNDELADAASADDDSCPGPVKGTLGLLVTFEHTDALKGLRLTLGDSTDDAQWTASEVRVRFDDGSCVVGPVDADSGEVSFDAVATGSALITVVAAESPNGSANPFVAIRGVQPLARPE